MNNKSTSRKNGAGKPNFMNNHQYAELVQMIISNGELGIPMLKLISNLELKASNAGKPKANISPKTRHHIRVLKQNLIIKTKEFAKHGEQILIPNYVGITKMFLKKFSKYLVGINRIFYNVEDILSYESSLILLEKKLEKSKLVQLIKSKLNEKNYFKDNTINNAFSELYLNLLLDSLATVRPTKQGILVEQKSIDFNQRFVSALLLGVLLNGYLKKLMERDLNAKKHS